MPGNFIHALSTAKTSEKERLILEELRQELLPLDTVPATESEEDVFEQEFLKYAKASFDDSNPFPTKSPTSLFTEENDLNRFTCYLFERRYGWSEVGKDGPRRVRRLSCGSVLPSDNVHHKAIINDILGDFLKWYRHQPLSVELLKAYRYTLSQASQIPVVRNQSFVHIMDWVKRQAKDIPVHHGVFELVKSIIVAGLTDVWSAIRSACASRLSPVCAELDPNYLQALFEELTKICQDEASSWQSVEGAVMGLNAVIKGFPWRELNEDVDQTLSQPGRVQVCDKGVAELLRSVSGQVKDVIYPLLSHPQLTIREQATKTLASYLSRNHFKESLACFEQVIERLCQGTRPFLENTKQVSPVHLAAMNPDYRFLDAYAAEGLLSVCVLLVKRIPVGYLLPEWPRYLSTFLLYLMHPASTVRQTTSSVFKYLVSTGSTNPVFVKLVLSELIKDWTPDIEKLGQTDERRPKIPSDSLTSNRTSVVQVNTSGAASLSSTWEWREGRLFAYELIVKFLIKNHWLYTFGPGGQLQSADRITGCGAQGKDSPSRNQMTRRISEATVLSQVCEQDQNSNGKTSDKDCGSCSQDSKSRVMTTDSLIVNGKNLAGCSHGRPYSPRNRCHDPHSPCRTPVGMASLFSQLQKLEQSLPQVDGGYQHPSKAMEKQQGILRGCLQNKDSCGQSAAWLNEVDFKPISSLLTTMFYQITECVVDGQWELRRMGIQTLPCLTEMMRWYDMTVVVSLLTSHLKANPSPLTFTCVLTLRDSLLHASTLQLLSRNPPQAWQDQDRCKDAIIMICCLVQENLEGYLPLVQTLLTRASYDKLSVIACCALMMAVSNFHLAKNQKTKASHCVLDYWKHLFCLTHPDSSCTAELLVHISPCTFQSPEQGYLSCCLVRPEGPLQCAKQVEKVFMMESQNILLPFIKTLSCQDAAYLLPILAYSTGTFSGDSSLSKVIVDCLSHLCTKIADVVLKEDCSFRGDGIRYIYLTLKELSCQISSKTLDLQVVRHLLEIYLTLSRAIVLKKHLSSLLTAICARINQTNSFMVQVSPRPSDDLAILSNDIPPSSSSDVESENSDSEEVGGPQRMFPECFSLNVSNNSGSFASGRLSALSTHSSVVSEGRVMTPASSVQSDGEQNSDWDSWSDEEEDQSVEMSIFADFLGKLQLKSTGNTSVFRTEIQKMEDSDKKLIRTLLDNNI